MVLVRRAYAAKLAISHDAPVEAAERKVEWMEEKVNLAKLKALEQAGVPAAGMRVEAEA